MRSATTKGSLAVLGLLGLGLLIAPRFAVAQGEKSDEGQKVYDQNCAKCHGPDGSGNTAIGKAVGAKDLRAAEAKNLTDAQIRTQIEQGKNNMPPFGGTLNKAQIDSLIPVVRSFSKKAAGGKKGS